MSWAIAAPAVAAAFAASLVEVVEAFTILLAVGVTRGWRPALLGAVAGLGILVLLVAALGPLVDRLPLAYLQFGVGLLLLLFGMRWLRKAILRAAGVLPLHDEQAIYAEERARLRGERSAGRGLDAVAVATAAKAVLLEGLEVVFIVLAVGAKPGLLLPASLGALAALLAVVGAGLLFHRPLARVPENSLKFAVGIILSAFGVFWIGEGLAVPWPGEDLALVGIAGAFLLCGLALVALARRSSRARRA
jgi:uncharacterized membrane protein